MCLLLPNVSWVARTVILWPEGFLAYRRGEDVFKKEQNKRQREIKENIRRVWYACDAKGKRLVANRTVRLSCMKIWCLAKLRNCLFTGNLHPQQCLQIWLIIPPVHIKHIYVINESQSGRFFSISPIKLFTHFISTFFRVNILLKENIWVASRWAHGWWDIVAWYCKHGKTPVEISWPAKKIRIYKKGHLTM
jgi:hypothetical protein